MIRVDLNRIAIAGLLLFVAAVVVLIVDYNSEGRLTMAYVFGAGAPWPQIPIWMILAVAAAILYLLGRAVWLIRHHFYR